MAYESTINKRKLIEKLNIQKKIIECELEFAKRLTVEEINYFFFEELQNVVFVDTKRFEYDPLFLTMVKPFEKSTGTATIHLGTISFTNDNEAYDNFEALKERLGNMYRVFVYKNGESVCRLDNNGFGISLAMFDNESRIEKLKQYKKTFFKDDDDESVD